MKYLAITIVFHFLFFSNIYLQAQWIQTNSSTSPQNLDHNNSNQLITKHHDSLEEQKIEGYQLLKSSKKDKGLNTIIYRPSIATYDSVFRHIFTYDNSGNCLTDVYDTLSLYFAPGEWMHCNRTSYTYDKDGNQITELEEEYYYGDLWGKLFRQSYTYNNTGKLITSFAERWILSGWENYYRFTYTYDSLNNLISKLEEDWLNNAWTNWHRYTYMYDLSGNQIESFSESYATNEWVNYDRNTYTFDAGGNCITEKYEQWRDQWYNQTIDYYTYDNAGNCITDINQYWQNNDWANMNKMTYLFDKSNNNDTTIYETWENNNWVICGDYLYTHDNAGNTTSAKFLRWQDSTWSPVDCFFKLLYNNKQDYLLCEAKFATVEYSLFTDIAHENKNILNFNLEQNYPNPFNPSTVISYSLPSASKVKLIIYNTLGQIVKVLEDGFKTAGKYTIIFNASNLPSGIYFYKLEAGQFNQVKKMMLIK